MTAADRREALASVLRSSGHEAALVTDLVNVRYLTGFTGSNGALRLTAEGSATFATDGRYQDQAAREVPDVERVITRDLLGRLADGLTGTVAVETHALSVDEHARLLSHTPGAALHSIDRAVERLRELKDDDEIGALRVACAISVEALTGLYEGRLVGRTERDIARDIEARMLDLGAEAVGFDTIVATGPHSAIPHHSPTDRVVGRGDFLKIDFGARVDGYHADCTRTVVLGEAADWQRDVYASVRAAQQVGIHALVPGGPIGATRLAVDRSLRAAGWLDYFTTGLGHGVGLQIHEDPFLHEKHTGKVTPRMTVTIEPGIYLPGRGGVRIEDTLVITDSACEVLTVMATDLLELA